MSVASGKKVVLSLLKTDRICCLKVGKDFVARFLTKDDMKDFVTALVDNPAALIILEEGGSGLWMVQVHLLSSFFWMQFPSASRAISITLFIAKTLLALVTGSDLRPARNSPMVFCANFSANEPGWAVPRRQNKTIIQPHIPVISIPHSVQCNVVFATKETLMICYLDLFCIKMDNILKIAELSVVLNAGLVELLVASVPQTRLTSARLTVATWMVHHQDATLNRT